MRLIQLLIFLFWTISTVSSLQCWTGKIDDYLDGHREMYITDLPCNAGYCSNMTVERIDKNETELHCGNQLLEGCDGNNLGCFVLPTRTAEMCCCDTPLCNDTNRHDIFQFTQFLIISFTLLSLPFVRF